MRKILKVKDWMDNKHAIESVMGDWLKRVQHSEKIIRAENLTSIVDPKTGELNITFKIDPSCFSQDFF